jgi:hypothetical protein
MTPSGERNRLNRKPRALCCCAQVLKGGGLDIPSLPRLTKLFLRRGHSSSRRGLAPLFKRPDLDPVSGERFADGPQCAGVGVVPLISLSPTLIDPIRKNSIKYCVEACAPRADEFIQVRMSTYVSHWHCP